jgi:hypothetical protein
MIEIDHLALSLKFTRNKILVDISLSPFHYASKFRVSSLEGWLNGTMKAELAFAGDYIRQAVQRVVKEACILKGKHKSVHWLSSSSER